jgi:hypothetical protein
LVDFAYSSDILPLDVGVLKEQFEEDAIGTRAVDTEDVILLGWSLLACLAQRPYFGVVQLESLR